jgi:hypothetical protein
MTLVAVRIIHLTTYVTAVVIAVSYSASLISHIMTYTHTLPFVDFRGLVADGTYQLGLLANSGYIPFFKVSYSLCDGTVRSESRCALRLRYVGLVVCIEVAVEVCCCSLYSAINI